MFKYPSPAVTEPMQISLLPVPQFPGSKEENEKEMGSAKLKAAWFRKPQTTRSINMATDR